MGPETYGNQVINKTLIGKCIKKIWKKNKKLLEFKFNRDYYIGKNEHFFTEFPEITESHIKNCDIGQGYLTERARGSFVDYIAKV